MFVQSSEIKTLQDKLESEHGFFEKRIDDFQLQLKLKNQEINERDINLENEKDISQQAIDLMKQHQAEEHEKYKSHVEELTQDKNRL